ncbi:hypothetical protein ROZALSC1DRAFT_28651 [Rozella allomycis CSF55]|uniref:Probable electron transfer flavoprotein subunit alpha n=1 Tax=Rozella allomycis (strain CSF55) TaxID=988480 RepID=A0A4P9YK18_ROZAC|nr:hypothetical protein ROZALSC1DRAFT_28651 [Rozella allomycis CSF55]
MILNRLMFHGGFKRLFSSMVIAEHKGDKLASSTLHAITAARQLNQPITTLVAGKNCKNVISEVSKIEGVSKVVHIDNELLDHPLAETLCPAIISVQNKFKFNYLIAAHTASSKNILPRVAALLDVAQISDVMAIKDSDTFVRSIYAGNAIATVKSLDSVKVVTIRPSSFAPSKSVTGQKVEIEEFKFDDIKCSSRWVAEEIIKSDRPELGSAEIVVSGGRGLKNQENFQLMYKLADTIGAAVGASRAAVDAGYAPNDLQVGQTGKIVAPKLYIAVGISGAIQHLAGMKDSKVIVAINKDPDAPIFQVADYGLVGDLFQAVPELIEKLGASKK